MTALSLCLCFTVKLPACAVNAYAALSEINRTALTNYCIATEMASSVARQTALKERPRHKSTIALV